MRQLVIFVLFIVLEGKQLHKVEEKRVELLQLPRKGQCDVSELKTDEVRLKCTARDGSYVPNGDRCMFIPKTLDRPLWASCKSGMWTSVEAPDGRTKREVATGVLAGVLAVGSILCLMFCSRSKTVYVEKKAPTYSNCPPTDIQSEYFANEGTRERIVSWTNPTASDSDGSIASDAQVSTPSNGQPFQGSANGHTYTVQYVAKDNDGMSGYCFFNFKVTIRTCGEIKRLDNGYKTCNKENIYGSECSFYCDEGYELAGDTTAKCLEDGSWSSSMFSCTKKRCDAPAHPQNGSVSCNDTRYEYQSVCSFSCDPGFTLKGSLFTQCQADQTWALTEDPQCVDTDPPHLYCLTPQVFYADRGVLTASSVEWEEPTAKDTVDPNPVVIQTSGPQPGTTLTNETTWITYQATDASGNVSPECSIKLLVQPITCESPADTLNDTKLLYSCSDSLYYYGVSCQLSCDYNLPLEGVSTITCEALSEEPIGMWDWTSELEPYCREVECPPLDPPINGALAHETRNQRPVVILFCQENFDIPDVSNFDGKLYCYDSGTWSPLTEVPDCIHTHNPRRMRLPSELYYYSGNCSDETTQQQIKEQFLSILATDVDPFYLDICPHDITCTIDSVTVTCGPINKRKRRSDTDQTHKIMKRSEYTHATIVTFDIVTGWVPGNRTVDEAYNFTDNLQAQQKRVIETLLAEGKLDIDGVTLTEDSFQTATYGSLSCDPGMTLEKEKCKPCPRGMYMDTENQCQKCPIGQYMDTDGTTSCKMCPKGTSTEKIGSKALDNCTAVCIPGSYSKNGLAPCSLCPTGSYQAVDGMTSCLSCPSGETTSARGSISQAMCQRFDVHVGNTMQDVSLGNISTTDGLSIAFWVKSFSAASFTSASLKIVDESGILLKINIAPEISVVAGSSMLETAVILSDTKWDHVTVVWNPVGASIQVYVNAEVQKAETVSLRSFSTGEIVIYSEALAGYGIYLSGLQVIARKLQENEISPLLTSCMETLDQAILNMDSFLDKTSTTIRPITPSICDAMDECSSSPCGQHRCVNEIGNFTCICSQGMTGRLCEVPRNYCINHECQHGSSCISHETNYSCSCMEGFTGPFCEIPPVDGGWSDFGEWSSCSVTCDQGTRIRSRSCNNPPAGPGGQDCSGLRIETEDCFEEECRECSSSPSRSFGITPNCSTNSDTGIRYCYPYCRDGTYMQPGLEEIETYMCGPNTDYNWTPFDSFPECMAEGNVGRPNMYTLETSVNYDTSVPSSSVNEIESKIGEKISATDCVNKALCTTSMSLGNSGSRKKRGSGATLQITFNVVLGNTGELRLDEYVATGIISAALQEVIDSIVSLELTAAELQANASTYFNVDIGGVTYSVNDSSLTLHGIIDCPDGSISQDGVCVQCPAGTKAESYSCVYCNVGFYQDETGQTDCKPCPSGTSTAIIGGRNVSNCTVSITVTQTSHATPVVTSPKDVEEDDDNDDNDHDMSNGNNIGVIAGISIGTFALVLAIIAIVLVLYKKHTRRNNRGRNQNGSFASFSMVRPDSRQSSGSTYPDSGMENSRYNNLGFQRFPTKEALPSVCPTDSGAAALKRALEDDNEPAVKFTAKPRAATCLTPPPPYTENP